MMRAMIRDEPVNPHQDELGAYDREAGTRREEVHRPAPGEWLVIPLVRLGTKSTFWLSAGLCAVGLFLTIIAYSSPPTASLAPILFAVAAVTGIIAAYYGSVLRDEKGRA